MAQQKSDDTDVGSAASVKYIHQNSQQSLDLPMSYSVYSQPECSPGYNSSNILSSDNDVHEHVHVQFRDELRQNEIDSLKTEVNKWKDKYEEEKLMRKELERQEFEDEDDEEKIEDYAPLLPKKKVKTQPTEPLGFWERLLSKCECMAGDEHDKRATYR